MTIRALVLSGGGGRGAFHAGVYKYLCEADKPGIDAAHRDPWIPEIVVGTSIGAVNGAAITQGLTAEELENFWLSLREHDIQGLPPGMGLLTRHLLNWFLKGAIGVRLPRVPQDKAMSPNAKDFWPPIPLLPARISDWIIGRWSNLLDTAPLRDTLTNRLKLDENKIANSDKTLFISATNIRTGEAVSFSNRAIIKQQTGQTRLDVRAGITMNRIVASCSIPLVYPWTRDIDGTLFWDGAVVANTPLGPAFDATKDRPMEEPMEVVVVLLNPWWESGEAPPPRDQEIPQDFGEAVTWTLDWALLASFRVSLKLQRSFNKLARQQLLAGQPQTYRLVEDIIIAPERFLPVARIIDYDEPASRELIDLGYQAAEKAFQSHFGE